MDRQIIVAIGREYGSAGHEIAQQIADDMGLAFYDQQLIDEIAHTEQLDTFDARMFDDVPKSIMSAPGLGENMEPGENKMAEVQFELIKKHAASGESFVIVGRCAEHILREYPCLVTVFIMGNMKQKQRRIMNLYQMTAEEAKAAIAYHDRQRQTFHNSYSDTKWGEAKGYDLCINSSKLGVKNTTRLLEEYIKLRMEAME